MEFRKGGSEYIRREIGFGIQNGTRRANIIGEWEIESAVRIPEDFTLILDNCHLKMADNTFDNMFINEHHDISEQRHQDFPLKSPLFLLKELKAP